MQPPAFGKQLDALLKTWEAALAGYYMLVKDARLMASVDLQESLKLLQEARTQWSKVEATRLALEQLVAAQPGKGAAPGA